MAVAKAEAPARKWLARHRDSFNTTDGYPNADQRGALHGQISGGKYVGILSAQNLLITGRAVMKTRAGWVLGCASQVVATPENTVYVAGAELGSPKEEVLAGH